MTDTHTDYIPPTTVGNATVPAYATGPVATRGYAGDSGAVPAVRAALAVLDAADAHLAAFARSGHCITEGAYLDPDRAQGWVILSLCTLHCDHLVSPTTGADRLARIVGRRTMINSWERLFRDAGWEVSDFPDQFATGAARRMRLVPPRPPRPLYIV